MIWLMVAAGGALGSVARFGVAHAIARAGGTPVPHATAIVNVVGCAMAGVLLGLIASQRVALTVDQRALLFSGILGGLTTFSGIGIDTLALTEDARITTAALNIVAQVMLGMAAVFGGYALARG